MPGLTSTRTRTVIFDRDLVSKVEQAVDDVREEWERRSAYVSDPAVLAAAKARMDIANGLVMVLKDPAE